MDEKTLSPPLSPFLPLSPSPPLSPSLPLSPSPPLPLSPSPLSLSPPLPCEFLRRTKYLLLAVDKLHFVPSVSVLFLISNPPRREIDSPRWYFCNQIYGLILKIVQIHIN